MSMRWMIVVRLVTLATAIWCPDVLGQDDASTAGTKDWKLTWSDEFEGQEIDRTKWDSEQGNGFYNYDANVWIPGWGNDELQYYTREPENVFVRDGFLHLRALKSSYQGFGFTSAKLMTRKRDGSPLFNQRYGRIEFRAQLPKGQGVWPALWLLPQSDTYGPWPASGEIDVMEARGQEPGKVLGTLHYGARWPANKDTSHDYRFPDGDDFTYLHTYALEWEPGEMRWFVDDTQYARQDFWWSSSKTDGNNGAVPRAEAELNAWPAPFDQPFYLVMNVAVGGRFVGNPNRTTPFPAEMLVDYVRVYERTGEHEAVVPRGPGSLPFAK